MKGDGHGDHGCTGCAAYVVQNGKQEIIAIPLMNDKSGFGDIKQELKSSLKSGAVDSITMSRDCAEERSDGRIVAESVLVCCRLAYQFTSGRRKKKYVQDCKIYTEESDRLDGTAICGIVSRQNRK